MRLLRCVSLVHAAAAEQVAEALVLFSRSNAFEVEKDVSMEGEMHKTIGASGDAEKESKREEQVLQETQENE